MLISLFMRMYIQNYNHKTYVQHQCFINSIFTFDFISVQLNTPMNEINSKKLEIYDKISLKQHQLLYIFTCVWVLHTPNARQSLLFKHFESLFLGFLIEVLLYECVMPYNVHIINQYHSITQIFSMCFSFHGKHDNISGSNLV